MGGEAQARALELDPAHLVGARPVGESADPDVVGDDAGRLVERVGATVGVEALEGGHDLLGRAAGGVAGGELRSALPHVDHRHVAGGVVQEQPLGVDARRQGHRPGRTPRLNTEQAPGADEVLPAHDGLAWFHGHGHLHRLPAPL